MIQTEPIEILLVEDSPGDVELIQHGLRRSKLCSKLHVVSDGEEAMKHLESRSVGPDNKRPDLVLLDIHLPRMNGHEVLRKIRENQRLHTIPVVILTTSDHEDDVMNAYNERANAYIQKPNDAAAFIDTIHSIVDFWLSMVKLRQQ